MPNPRLRHLPSGNSGGRVATISSFLDQNKEQYIRKQTDFKKRIQKRIGLDQVVDIPIINPIAIMEEIKSNPRVAARRCRQACQLLSQGHHNRIHEYLIVAYQIGLELKARGNILDWLATDVFDVKTKHKTAMAKIDAKPLNYLFIFIFAQSGLTTRNRANHYAESLQPFYDVGSPAAEVDVLLRQHGQERLRKAAARLKAIGEAGSWATTGSPLPEPNMIDALNKMNAEEPEEVVVSEEETDWGPRVLPPDQEPSCHNDSDTPDTTASSDGEEVDEGPGDDGESSASNDADDDDASDIDFDRAQVAIENGKKSVRRLKRAIRKSNGSTEEKNKMRELVEKLAREFDEISHSLFLDG